METLDNKRNMKTKKINKLFFNLKGQSMYEVVLALAVISLVIVALIILATNSIRNTTFSKNQNVSSRYAQEAVEWIRDQRNSDPANFRSKVLTPTYCLNSLVWTNIGACSSSELIGTTSFTRQVSFSTTSQNNQKGESVVIINVTVTVSWTDGQGDHEVKSVTDFADFREL